MKKIKKAAAVTAAAVLCVGMTATAFASEVTNSATMNTVPNDVTFGVTGSYDGTTTDGAPVYKIDVAWGSMEFTYEANATRVWNTTTHQYDTTPSGIGVWKANAEGTSNKITVTNHSNAAVEAGLEFGENSTGITGKFTDGAKDITSLSLASAETTNAAVEDEAFFEITGGTLDEGTTNSGIGTITVSITSAEAATE